MMMPEVSWPDFWLSFIEKCQVFAAFIFFAAWLAILPALGVLYLMGLLP